mgnify:CR=1 FL=1
MKSFFAFILILAVTSIQNQSFAQIAVGIIGGANISTAEIYKRPDYRTRDVETITGYQFGAVFRYVSEKHVGMHIEFLYSRKGWRDVSAIEGEVDDQEHVREINYLEIPFMTHFIIGSKKVRILLEGGPYFGYALSSKEQYKNIETGEIESESNFEWQDGVDNRLDYGLKGSGGFQFYFPFGAIEVKGFYSYGYGNIFLDKSEAVETSQNRNYGLNVGYMYFFGKKKNIKPKEVQQ